MLIILVPETESKCVFCIFLKENIILVCDLLNKFRNVKRSVFNDTKANALRIPTTQW